MLRCGCPSPAADPVRGAQHAQAGTRRRVDGARLRGRRRRAELSVSAPEREGWPAVPGQLCLNVCGGYVYVPAWQGECEQRHRKQSGVISQRARHSQCRGVRSCIPACRTRAALLNTQSQEAVQRKAYGEAGGPWSRRAGAAVPRPPPPQKLNQLGRVRWGEKQSGPHRRCLGPRGRALPPLPPRARIQSPGRSTARRRSGAHVPGLPPPSRGTQPRMSLSSPTNL